MANPFQPIAACMDRPAVLESLEPRALLATDVILEWNDILLDAIRSAQTPPPYAARNLAIVHTAIFDAVNAVEREYEPYLVSHKAPRRASAEAAAVGAAHRTLTKLYPDLRDSFDDAFNDSLAGIPNGPGEKSGLALGRSIANRILAARRHDGADDIVEYIPGADPEDWKPTPPALVPALYPNWPGVTPFALTSADQFRSAAPPAMDSAEFTAAFNRVKDLGSATSTTRTADQTGIALFWADGAGTATPPGHWNMIAQDISESRNLSLIEDARLFALLNIALADAGIASWDAKYAFNLCRPITAIRNADIDNNPDTHADPDWTPLIATPPFPTYTSGHSTFSAAAAAILAGFFGADDITFTTTSDALPGVTRTFTSFSDAAAEAGDSRIYGGIHWDFDNTAGLEAGQLIGQFILQNTLLASPGGAVLM